MGGLLHSDVATEILTGREMFRQKTIFLSEYYHSTELILLRSSLIMALWTFVTRDMLDTFRLSVVTEVALQSVCYVYAARRLGLSPLAAAIGLLAFFGVRGYGSGRMCGLGGASYGVMHCAVFLILGYCAAARSGRLARADQAARLIIPVLAFFSGLSSLRFIAAILGPLLMAHCAAKLWTPLPRDWAGDALLREILFWTAVCAAGWIITVQAVMPRGFGPMSYGTSALNGLAVNAAESAPALARDVAALNPVARAGAGLSPLSARGASGLLCAAFYAACAWGIAWTRKPYLPARRAAYAFLLMSIWPPALLMLVMFPPGEMTVRYLFNAYVLLAAAAGFLYEDLRSFRPALARAFLVLCCSLCVFNSFALIREIPGFAARNPSVYAIRHLDDVGESLRRHGLDKAYSLYYQSTVQQVLTDGRYEVWPVLGDMTPAKYLVRYDVYDPGRAGERAAFIRIEPPLPYRIPPNVINTVTDESLLAGAAEREVLPDPEVSVEIFYFDRNPFVFPPGHDPAADYAGR
jgi:hypothetical protein